MKETCVVCMKNVTGLQNVGQKNEGETQIWEDYIKMILKKYSML
jgi:hypothetical protein